MASYGDSFTFSYLLYIFRPSLCKTSSDQFYLLGYDAVYVKSVESQPTYRRDMSATCFILVSFLAYYSTMNMEAKYFSETLVDFQRTTWHDIPEDSFLHNLRRGNLWSCTSSDILGQCELIQPFRTTLWVKEDGGNIILSELQGKKMG
jgi:hypothetical protein